MTLPKLLLIYFSFGKTAASGARLHKFKSYRHDVNILAFERAKLLKPVKDCLIEPVSKQTLYSAFDRFFAYAHCRQFGNYEQQLIEHCWKLVLFALAAADLIKGCRQASRDNFEFKKPFLPNRCWACHHPRDPPKPVQITQSMWHIMNRDYG